MSTEQGTFVSTNGGQSWRPRDTSFGARLAWPEADALYSLDRNGKLRVSADGGESWKDRGDVGGLPSEITTTGRKDELFVAIVGGKIRKSIGWRQDLEHRGHLAVTAAGYTSSFGGHVRDKSPLTFASNFR